MNIKRLLATAAFGAIVATSVNSLAMADPGTQGDSSRQVRTAAMNGRIQHRLEQLSQRLEIKASQQGEWEEYVRSVSMLEDRNWKRPDKDADAASIAHFRADRATVLAKELTVIAEATDKLQKVLTEDQRKIFNQVSRLSMHKAQERMRHGQGLTDGNSHGDK
jgi:hypothetical protein